MAVKFKIYIIKYTTTLKRYCFLSNYKIFSLKTLDLCNTRIFIVHTAVLITQTCKVN